MDIHRKFFFESPEDNFWNENVSDVFSENSATAVVARRALDDLFECGISFNDTDTISVVESEKLFNGTESDLDYLKEPDVPSSNSLQITQKELMDSIINVPPSFIRKPTVGSSSMISDCSVGSFSRNSDATTIHLDYGRLKSEHSKLQRHLDHIRQERFHPLSIPDTIKRLCSCRPVSLDLYRSKEQKVELLDTAILTRDHDVILTIVLFLKRTLINSIFREMLLFKSEAANVYLHYLRDCGDHTELVESLFALGRTDEAAIIEFTIACRKKQPDAKVSALKKCLISGFSSPDLAEEAGYVEEYIHLLERQIPIDSTDEEASKSGCNDLFKQFPKKASLIGQPLLTTLYYCCLYHYSMPANSYSSPLAFKQAFNVSDKEFLWMALSALSRRRIYVEIEKLLTTKKMLGSAKMVCPFPWPAFFSLIIKYGAPPKEMLVRWLKAVPDVEERLKIAGQFGEDSREVEIDGAIHLKDRQKLLSLVDKLNPRSVEYNKAQLVLSNSSVKWKN